MSLMAFFAQKPKKWRCTARQISPTQFVMRFPNAREVERACCYGKKLPILDDSVIVSISPWSASVGAKADLQKAWVRVRNVPLEKRCVQHVSYAGAVVGVTLEVDKATLHKPEYACILLGCREVDKIQPSAEGMLGEQFYDFYYEVERLVVGAPAASQYSIPVDSNSPSAPKKARFDFHASTSYEQGGTSASAVGDSFCQNYSATTRLSTVSENEEEEESDEENHIELLIYIWLMSMRL